LDVLDAFQIHAVQEVQGVRVGAAVPQEFGPLLGFEDALECDGLGTSCVSSLHRKRLIEMVNAVFSRVTVSTRYDLLKCSM
jgi:hypothetical protein